MSLSIDANERLYDALAEALDRVGPANEALYLTKLALLLANRVGDEAAVYEALQAAAAFSPAHRAGA
jgi:Protein of unknown function (DUF2783)